MILQTVTGEGVQDAYGQASGTGGDENEVKHVRAPFHASGSEALN
jgi:hypothetical protein